MCGKPPEMTSFKSFSENMTAYSTTTHENIKTTQHSLNNHIDKPIKRRIL